MRPWHVAEQRWILESVVLLLVHWQATLELPVSIETEVALSGDASNRTRDERVAITIVTSLQFSNITLPFNSSAY